MAHGYPPRERAGTEQHVATVAAGLVERGWRVGVLAATRDPARPQYARWEEEGAHGERVFRLVQNMPVRALSVAEEDRAVQAEAGAVVAAFAPDLVHVHHVQFLSSGLRFAAPTALTLHDAWLWCPAGGQLIERPARLPCAGPTPERCAPCAAAWAPTPGSGARLLLGAAGRLAGTVPPERLHRAFRVVPERLRRRLQAPRRGAPTETATAATHRARAMRAFAEHCALRLAPSRFLADAATAAGLGSVDVLPHGLPAAAPGPRPAERDGPFLFLGTGAWHKGPDRVLQAWRRAFPDGGPGLRLHGPLLEPDLVAEDAWHGALGRDEVHAALQGARALVLGSRWPENAPLVVLEARRAGCPVIAPATGGLPELVEPGRDGWLYDDDEGLVAALRECVAAPLEQPPRAAPSLDAHLDALEALYARLLQGQP